MQSHLEARKQDSDIISRAFKVADYIVSEFSDLGIQHDLVLKVLGILDVNSFEIPSTEATVQVKTKLNRVFIHEPSRPLFRFLVIKYPSIIGRDSNSRALD